MDILIPLGFGSRWQNNELRFCLRSIEKHLKGYDKVFIIGEKPEWISHIIHIPCDDNPNGNKIAHNIFRKIIAGCNDERLSDDFIFFSDDHYLLTDFEASEFPYYHRGNIQPPQPEVNMPQHVQMWNTVDHLKRAGATYLDFNIHCPIVYNKQKFISTFSGIVWPQHGYGIKSMYCNLNGITGSEYSDLKFSVPLMRQSIYQALEERTFFSIGNRCLKGEMKEILQELYPNKSKYEG